MSLQFCKLIINNYEFPADDAGFLTRHFSGLYGGKTAQALAELFRDHAKDCLSPHAGITYTVDSNQFVTSECYLIGSVREKYREGDFYPYLAMLDYRNPDNVYGVKAVYEEEREASPAEAATKWVNLCQQHPSVLADTEGVNNYTYLINQAKQFIMAVGAEAEIIVQYNPMSDRVTAIIIPSERAPGIVIQLCLG